MARKTLVTLDDADKVPPGLIHAENFAPAAGSPNYLPVTHAPLPVLTDPLTIAPWTSMYWASRIVGVADGAATAQWSDLLAAGNHLTGALQPTYAASSPIYGGRPALVFDGTKRIQTAALAVPIPQPYTVAWIAHLTNSATFTYLFSGAAGSSGAIFRTGLTTSNWRLDASGAAAGTGLSHDKVDANPRPHLFVATFNGPATNLRIDTVQSANLDAGAQSLGQFRLAAYTTGGSIMTGGVVWGAILAALLTPGQLAGLEAWAPAYYPTLGF